METLTQQAHRKDEKVSKIIDRVLNQIFGEEATLLIYRHLEHNYSLKRNEIGERLDVFAQGLEEFLKSGAYVIEKKILEDISASYGSVRRLEPERPCREGNFVSAMKLIMRKA